MTALLLTAGMVAGSALTLSLALSILVRLVWRRAFYRPWGFADPGDSDVPNIELVDLAETPGEHLYLWHLAPTAPGAPVLVFFDGVRGNLGVWNRRWRRIAAAGAGFAAVSYRGYGGSTGRPDEDGLHEDAEAAWDWATTQYAENRLLLHGYSMGCAPAAKLAASGANRRLVLEGATPSIRRVAMRFLPFLIGRIAVPDALSVERWLPRVTGPVLIVHGAKDAIVPLAYARRLLRRARAPKRLEVIPDGNHVNLAVSGLYPRLWSWLGYAPGGAYADAIYTEETPGERPFAAPQAASAPIGWVRYDADALGHPLRREGTP